MTKLSGSRDCVASQNRTKQRKVGSNKTDMKVQIRTGRARQGSANPNIGDRGTAEAEKMWNRIGQCMTWHCRARVRQPACRMR